MGEHERDRHLDEADAGVVGELGELLDGVELALVGGLPGDEALVSALARHPLCFDHLAGGEGGRAEVADLALATEYTSLRAALLAAAVLLVGSVLLGLVLQVPESQGEDRSPLAYWDTPRLQVNPTTADGPVVVSVQYEVADPDQDAFLDAMRAMRRSRLRSGASRWELYRVGEDSHRYVEQFEVPSWEEHERQHEGRLTAEDKAIEDAAFAHVTGSPQTQHLLPADSRVAEEDISR